MKKKLFALSVIFGACTCLMAGTGSAATLDEVLEGYANATKEVTSVSADMDMNLKLALNMSSEASGTSTMNMGILGDFSVAAQMEPISFSMSGGMKVDAMGMGQEMSLEVYAVPSEDGSKLDLYAYTNEDGTGEWEYTSMDLPEMEKMMETINAADIDLSEFPGEFTLGEDTEVDGTACYKLLCTMDYEDMKPFIEEAMDASGEEMDEQTMAIAEAVLAGLVFNMEIDLKQDDYKPLRLYMDMNGSDLSALNSILAASMASSSDEGTSLPEISLDISELYVEALYDYDTPVSITVPEEALLAQKTGNDSNITPIQDPEDSISELDNVED